MDLRINNSLGHIEFSFFLYFFFKNFPYNTQVLQNAPHLAHTFFKIFWGRISPYSQIWILREKCYYEGQSLAVAVIRWLHPEGKNRTKPGLRSTWLIP